MNGLLSEPQEFVLETLRQFNALRLDQIKWLLQTKYKSRYGTINIRSVMRQLAYMGKVQAQENLWCALWRKPVPTLIDAFDIMMLMCDDTVPQFRVEHDQCQLTFYLPGGAGELPSRLGFSSDIAMFCSFFSGSSIYKMLAASCSAVVVFPHHFGPSISTAPLPSNFRIRISSAILFLYLFIRNTSFPFTVLILYFATMNFTTVFR